ALEKRTKEKELKKILQDSEDVQAREELQEIIEKKAEGAQVRTRRSNFIMNSKNMNVMKNIEKSKVDNLKEIKIKDQKNITSAQLGKHIQQFYQNIYKSKHPTLKEKKVNTKFLKKKK
ncbi:Hypothetical protein FKW44_014222, partial [Caligus rogercresseyi]